MVVGTTMTRTGIVAHAIAARNFKLDTNRAIFVLPIVSPANDTECVR